MALVTLNLVSVDTVDGAVLTAAETGYGWAPGSLVSLVDENPTDAANAEGAPDAAVWPVDSYGTGTGGMAALNFGPIVAPPTLTSGWQIIVTTGTGTGDPTGSDLSVAFTDELGVVAVFVAEYAHESTLTLTMAPAGGDAAAMEALLAGLGGDLVAFAAIEADAPYNPSFDSFQLRYTTQEGATVSNNCHVQTANCMLIAVPLDTSCAIVEDAPVYVTAGVGSLKAGVEREDGTDYTAKNFGGQYCGPDQRGDTLEKYLNIEGEFCLIDWAFMAATSGNVSMVDGDGNVIGYQQLRKRVIACQATDRPRFALTVIRASATGDGGCVTNVNETGATSAVAYTYPNVLDFVWDIPDQEDKRAMVPFKAKGYSSPNAGRGPLNLLPSGAVPQTIDPDAFFATYFVDPGSLPEVNCDETIAHPAPLSGPDVG